MNTEVPARTSSAGWFMIAAAMLVITLAATLGYYLWSALPEIGERSLASNLGFFLLINLNIIVVMILVFLVTKNIITLVLDRRRNILGSRLRARLVTAFVALSLFPTVMLFLVARGILESVLQGWFSPQIAASVDGALDVARFYSDSAQNELSREMRYLSEQLGETISNLKRGSKPDDLNEIAPLVHDLLKRKQEEHGLFSLALMSREGRELIRAVAAEPTEDSRSPPEANSRAVQRATTGNVIVRPEFSLNGEFIGGYAPVYTFQGTALREFDLLSPAGTESAQYVLVGTKRISPELGALLSEVINAYEDYNELKTYRRPLASSYLLTLVVVTLLIVFAAIWVGFYLAKSLSIPIGLLAKGTAQVAHGNLDHQIPETGDDELSILVRSFNVMTSDLKNTTEELVARRRYMEAVFAHAAVGVVTVDRELNLRAVNIAANEILGLNAAAVVDKPAAEVFPADLVKQLKEMSAELFTTSQKTLEANVSLPIVEQLKHLRVTLTKLTDEQGNILGAVVLLDDLTELVSAQRMAAWREVARRIAHEIKNPLTPIQLCAERIQRRFSGKRETAADPGDVEMVAESTDIIVKQVENLRNLVNEFSRFARMPKSMLRQGNLNELIGETLAIYRQAHPEIQFLLHLALDLPPVDFDREQLGRVLINLLDNAVAAVLSTVPAGKTPAGTSGTVSVQSSLDSGLGLVTVTVSDTGLGISEQDKKRLFEPYFSTKHGGTGLGLAIASAIVSDHNGFIRVKDNKPRGAVFIIELPAAAELSPKKLANERKAS